MNNGTIRLKKGQKLSCALCGRSDMLCCWPLRGNAIMDGVVSIIGVLCPLCRGLTAVGSSTSGFNKGWDELAIKLRDRGYVLTGMCGMYQRQSKKAKVWRLMKNKFGAEGARQQYKEIK